MSALLPNFGDNDGRLPTGGDTYGEDDNSNSRIPTVELGQYSGFHSDTGTDSLDMHMDFDRNFSPEETEIHNAGYEGDEVESERVDIVPISQIDLFCTNMYKYFLGRGFRNIIVTQVVNLLLVTFLVFFCIWLFSCVNFDLLMSITEQNPTKVHHISEIINWSGLAHMHWYIIVCLILFCAFFVWKVIRIVYDIQKMKEMQKFYNDHLNITDFEIATIRWQKVVEKLQLLQSEHQFYLGKDSFTLHNVANHILKKENYLVAMFNKGIFDFNIPYINIPFFTKTMEWNLQHSIINYLFDDRMKLKKEFLDYHNRETLAKGLQKRITLMAVLNLVLSPFLGLFLLFWGVFERGQEFYKTPSKMTNRRWSHLAKWKFREFNELPHVFYERMKLSGKYADDYLKQFPNYWASDIAKLFAFVLSTFLFVLFVGMLFNDFILFNLELGGNRSVFWWMGILSTVLLVLRGFIKDSFIFYPEKKLKKVAEFIHYIPDDWVENASQFSVRSKFLGYYEYRIWVMLKEILGIIINPILMLVRFRNETLQIVDFVRDYTLSHPELGYVCKFSVFELGLNPMMNSQRLSQLHTHCNEKKMEKSMFYFNRNSSNASNASTASNANSEPTSSDSNELFSKPVSQMHTAITTSTPQQSFLETSVFGLNSQMMLPNDSLMQGTLQNLNNAAFAPTVRPVHQGLANSTMQNQQRLLQSQFVTRNRNTGNAGNGQQSVFLPSVLVRPSQPQEQQIAFNSGTLINDIEAQLEAEENDSVTEVNMLDMFLGKK